MKVRCIVIARINLALMVKNMKYLSIVLFFICWPTFVFTAVAAEEPGLVFELKNSEKVVKLRWLVTDKHFDYTYVLSRAYAKAPDVKQEIARLKMADFATAQSILGDNEAALKLMFPFKAAKNQAEKNQSLAQNDNRLNMLLYLSVMEPVVAQALGQYYEDKVPVDGKAVQYTSKFLNEENLPIPKLGGFYRELKKRFLCCGMCRLIALSGESVLNGRVTKLTRPLTSTAVISMKVTMKKLTPHPFRCR